MKTTIIILIFAAMIGTATAETGIVLNATNHVQYKYNTAERPALQSGEYIIVHPDINSVLRGAKYQDGIFINPFPLLEPEERRTIRDNYQQAMTDIVDAKADLALIRNQTNMTEAQQTNNIRKLADYEYKLFTILQNILRFLKFAFFTW